MPDRRFQKAASPLPPRAADPAIPERLVEAASLSEWIACACGGDASVAHVRIAGDAVEGADFALLELSESRMEGCSYAGCDFDRAMVSDVAFAGCDFSNSTFSQANFTR